MVQLGEFDLFLVKAEESLAGAESEFVSGRYNNCANRAYYACFQAAIAALIRASIRPRGAQWGHDFVQAEFNGRLINRRKLYPPTLRTTLSWNYALREKADYDPDQVTERRAARAVSRTEAFVRLPGERGEPS